MLTGQGALNEIKDEFYWTLFRRLKSRAQTGLTRQKTAMHHHSKNEFSLFSCLVLSSFVFSSLVFYLLFRLLSSPGCCLLSLSLSVSVSFSVWCCGRNVLCCVVFCCVVLCVLVCDTLRNSVCPLNTSPCVPAPRAHVSTHVRVVPVQTGRFLNVHTGTYFFHR